MNHAGFAALVTVLVCAAPLGGRVSAQGPSILTGRWVLNRGLSQFPEVGFGADFVAGVGGANAGGGGSRRGGSRGGGGGGGASTLFPSRRESEDDAQRVKQLTAEVRNPPALLTVTETPAAVSVADERGRSRVFLTNGKESTIQLEDVPVAAIAKWQAGRLVVLYHVEEGRELRYTYGRTDQPPRLTVDVEFLERGAHDAVRRVYDAATEADVLRVTSAPPSTDTASPVRTDSTRNVQGQRPAPALPSNSPPPAFSQQPDAELKGLTALGVVIEDLSSQAAMCGLKSDAIDAAVSKSLTDAGLKITGHSDEDTYVYVSVITSVVAGICVSRYDAFLYTHTTARLSYGQAPALVQVSLLHQGGMAGGAASGHADAVLRVVKQYVDQFASRIRAANK